MKVNITRPDVPEILGSRPSCPNDKPSAIQWLSRLGCLSIFAAAATIAASEPAAFRGPEPVKGKSPRAGKLPLLPPSPRTGRNTPPFLRRQNDFRLPHQRAAAASAALAGNDNCPGTPVPPGVYTAQSPYIDSGDTTNGNDTVKNFGGGYYYSYSQGPDHFYSFTLTAIGPNPKIEVSTTSLTYDPMIYLLNGLTGNRCPANLSNDVVALIVADHFQPGGTEYLSGDFSFLPLNVPLHLGIDSRNSAGTHGQGQYTVKFQDLTIGPSTAPPANDAPLDMDGDGRSDFVIARDNAGQTAWYTRGANDTFMQPVNWGAPGDIFVPANYDADGKVDFAVWRPGAQGRFYVIRSQTQTLMIEDFGQTGDEPSVTSDYTGDGLADLAVFRPAAAPGAGAYWHIRSLAPGGTYTVRQFGEFGDKPVPGHYSDFNAKEIAVRHTIGAEGEFKWLTSWGTMYQATFGAADDMVAPGDYNGDGIDDFAIVRPGPDGLFVWDVQINYVIYGSDGNFTRSVWGVAATDILTPGDYDGDGRTEFSVWRPGNPGTFYQKVPNTGIMRTVSWGQNGDSPVANSLVR